MKGNVIMQPTRIDTMAHLAGEISEAVMMGQASGLRLLLAEMQALTQVMPGRALTEAERLATDAEVEADFDNMPV